MNESEKIKFARDYHLTEMNLRRNRQWQVLIWSISVLIALLSGILLSFRFLNIGAIESYFLISIVLLITIPSFLQIVHDEHKALAHWNAIHKIHQKVDLLKDYSDAEAGINRRLRPKYFIVIFAVFIVTVTFLLGQGMITVENSMHNKSHVLYESSKSAKISTESKYK